MRSVHKAEAAGGGFRVMADIRSPFPKGLWEQVETLNGHAAELRKGNKSDINGRTQLLQTMRSHGCPALTGVLQGLQKRPAILQPLFAVSVCKLYGRHSDSA